jgi:integrase
MPTEAKGEVRFSGGVWRARVTLKGKVRLDIELPHALSEDDARSRAAMLAAQAGRLRRAGKADTLAARELLKALGAEAEIGPEAIVVVDRLCGATGDPLAARGGGITFAKFAEKWTSGDLAVEYPGRVRKKDAAVDELRLVKLCAIDVGGIKLGDVPITRFTIDHAEAAMRKLPKSVKTDATRRQYAQVLSRVLALAVLPCRIIKVNPLGKGFLPMSGKPPEYPYLYPAEDRDLLAHKPLPLGLRVFWGFLSREGCRASEALALRLGDGLDLERGAVSLDENKTDDPRTWALDPGVTAALKRWVELRKAKAGDLLFPEAHSVHDTDRARLLRAHLLAAGVKRTALHEDGTNRRKLRVHDLRGTFVTLSLANGKTETWVADRTGHKSSIMINRYRRQSRTAAELNLGSLGALDSAIPELRRGPSPTGSPTKGGSGTPQKSRKQQKTSTTGSIAQPVEQWIFNPSDDREKSGFDGENATSDAPDVASRGPSMGDEIDPVECALAKALERASAAGEWAVVAALTGELAARRSGVR